MLSCVHFYNGIFKGIDLRDIKTVEKCSFNRLDLNDAKFITTSIQNSNFTAVQLVHSNFSQSHVKKSTLFLSNIHMADLSDISLQNGTFKDIYFAHCNLVSVAFYGRTLLDSNLTNCTGPTDK